jgi:hypothetical protein
MAEEKGLNVQMDEYEECRKKAIVNLEELLLFD